MNLKVNWKKIAVLVSAVSSYYLYRRYLLPVVINNTTKSIHQKLHNVKKKAFDEAFERVKSKNADLPVEILEVGVGSGNNFTLYPRDSKISFLDNTDAFLPYLKESFEKDNRDPNDFKLIVAPGEHMSMIESNSKDVVVHTFILCSVSDPNQVLKEIYRVLKPGGVCVFIEHSINTENFLLRSIQRLVSPLWMVCFSCKFLPIKAIYEAAKYNSLKVEVHKENGLFLKLVNPFVYGLATKE